MNDRQKKEFELIKQYCERKNYELVSTEYINVDTPFKYICNIHRDKGIQEVKWRNVKYRDHGCKYCGHEKCGRAGRLPEEEIKKLTEEKGFIYDHVEYSAGEYRKTLIYFICPNHKEKGIQIKNLQAMQKSTGKCNYCLGKTRTQEDFEESVKKINPHIKIVGRYRKTIEPVEFECKIDGYVWSTAPNNVLNGEGCPQCGMRILAEKKRKTQEQFEEEIQEKFNGRIEIISKYTGIKDLIKCRCKIDNCEWETTADSLLNSSTIGCPVCCGKSTGDRCRKSNEQFLKELSLANPNIEPLETYIDDHSKIKCRCKIHNHIWYVAPNKILHKTTGCPKCASYSNENKIDEILDKWGYKFTIQKRFPDCKDKYTLPFDRYLDDFNVLIEYDGEQHFNPIRYGDMTDEQLEESFRKTQLHDEIKNNYCEENNIPLIRIPYWEKDNIESFLFDELVKLKVIELVS